MEPLCPLVPRARRDFARYASPEHFGLDKATQVDRLEVRWPKSGLTQTFEAIAANQIIEIVEGETAWTRKRYGE